MSTLAHIRQCCQFVVAEYRGSVIQSSSSKCFHCNTAELCNLSNNAKFSGLSPVIVRKCRICQHFLQLHGLHKRPGLLFELMCCATLLRSGGCLHIFFWVTHLEQELIVAIKFYFLLFLYQHHHQPSPCPSNSNVQISHRSSSFQEMLIQEGHFLDQLANSLFSDLHCFR